MKFSPETPFTTKKIQRKREGGAFSKKRDIKMYELKNGILNHQKIIFPRVISHTRIFSTHTYLHQFHCIVFFFLSFSHVAVVLPF